LRLRSIAALAAALLSAAIEAPATDEKTAAPASEAATPTPNAPVASAPSPIPALEIPARAERVTAELYRQRAALRPDPAVDTVVADLPRMQASLEHLSAESWLMDGVTSRELEDVIRQWRRSDDQLTEWARIITRRNQFVEAGIARVRSTEDVWRATQEAAEHEALPAVVMEQIASVRAILRDARTSLQGQRDTLLGTASQIGGLQTMVVERLAQAEVAAARLRHQLLAFDAPPLWTSLRAGAPTEARGLDWQGTLRQLADFVRDARGRLTVYLLLVVLMFALALGIRGRLPSWPREVLTPAVLTLASRPVSTAVLATAVLAFFPGRNDPLSVSELAGLALLLPLWRVLESRLGDGLATAIPLLGALRIVALLRQMMPALSNTARMLLLAEILAALVWVVWALRSDRVGRSLGAADTAWPHYVRRTILAVLAVALAAVVMGNVTLAAFLTRGLEGAAFLALVLWAGTIVAEGFVTALLASRTLQRVRSVAYHASGLRQALLRTIRIAAPVAWVAGTLHLLDLLNFVVDTIREALGAHLRVGALALSAGDVIAFALTLFVSIVLARVVRALLEDDVLSRLALPRGVPSVISAAANYGILLAGFLFAVSAAGLDLSRVTILAGAFGVGIGFGLQNVVNNFVSGLILLFERLLQLGDVIEVAGVSGRVRRIGIRSSTIETFDGAEVIVPNGTLIAERVTNWTAREQRRRIDIPVSIVYGGDPEPVLALLQRVAAEHPHVQRQPAPEALLNGFGPGSLDLVLRVWVGYDRAIGVRSELVAAVDAGLREAGIVIPVPLSVAPRAAAGNTP
jgi:small-conductance mechanosensitive channel